MSQAPQALNEALHFSELADLDLKQPFISRVLSTAYYQLGQLYVPDEEKCISHQQDCEKAVDAFSRAINIDPTLHQAFIEQGVILESIGSLDRAISTYTQLIQVAPQSKEAVIAHGNRAAIYLKQKKFHQAAEDLSFACQRSTNPFYINWLVLRGKLELLTGQLKKAQITFQEIKKIVENKRELNITIAELNNLAQEKHELRSTIQTIVTQLEKD